MEADASPFPSDETTPPVTKMNLLMVAPTSLDQSSLICTISSAARHHPPDTQLPLENLVLLQLFGNLRYVFRCVDP